MSAQRQQDGRYKDYIPVAERIEKFYQDWPNGRVHTVIMEHNAETGFILFRAEVFRELAEGSPSSTGHAFEVRGAMPQHMQASYLEVCESSAVGRALMLLGYETKRGAQEAQRQTRPEAVPPQHGKLDNDILAAREILGKTHDQLNEVVTAKFGPGKPWRDRPEEQKAWLRDFLNKKVDEKAAEAK